MCTTSSRAAALDRLDGDAAAQVDPAQPRQHDEGGAHRGAADVAGDACARR
jgi:hypothetical protein